MEWALKMRRKHTMFKGERQCPTVNHNSIGSSRIARAPGLRMRRAGDADSETEAAFGGRPSASGLRSICSVEGRSCSRRACWSVEGESPKAWGSGGNNKITVFIEQRHPIGHVWLG